MPQSPASSLTDYFHILTQSSVQKHVGLTLDDDDDEFFFDLTSVAGPSPRSWSARPQPLTIRTAIQASSRSRQDEL